MKNKIYISLILSIFAFVFLFGLASALNINVAPSSIELSPYDNSKELTIINEDNENFDLSLSTDTLIVGNVQVDILNTTELNNVSIAKIKISADSEEIEENIDFGEFFENSFTLTIKDRENSSIRDTQEIFIKLSNNKFCDEENTADLDIDIESIDVIKGFGDDDEYWYPLDEIEIEIEVSDPEYDVEDIEIEFCLYDLEENECILDEDDIEISEDDFDLDEGDKIKTILSFKVDPEELTSGNKDYRIYIKAIGKIDDKNYEEEDEETCVSVYEDIEIVTDDEFVIIDNIVLNKEIFQCGEELRITADVWNIGDEELEDDEIFVRVYNKDLEIDEKIEFIRGIDEMDKEELDLIFKIPKEIEEKFYVIDMYAYDDEDMYANDIYENSEDDKAEYFVSVKVEGNCVKEIEDQVVVFANLESAANAGEKMIVKATVMNLGDDSSIYAINVANYAGWAYSATLDKTIFNLEKGSSEDVLITLDIKEDAYGSKSFDIELVLDEQVVLKQPITVSIESSEGIFGGLIENMKDNALLWSIGILNVILVLAIIIVAIKLIVKS
jgi:hypothetical protein